MMKNTVLVNLIISGVLALLTLGSVYSVYRIITHNASAVITSYPKERLAQPDLQYGIYPWSVRSIDTQVISKHWPDVTKEAVHEQISMIKELGINYVAIGTPYDRQEDLALWVNEIHAAGLHVWFRSHWAGWEGDEGYPATMMPEHYLQDTYSFIVNNPDLFHEGDAFTVAVEAEQGGVGLGKKFLTWHDYQNFLVNEIVTANDAFDKIGLHGKIHTNWLSVNGWVTENQFTPELVEQLDLIVVDHFVGQSQTIDTLEDSDVLVSETMKDLDAMYARWKKPILLGEWGYHIFQNVSEERQALVIDKLFAELKSRDYLVGVNYWVHMGNSAAILSDVYGTQLAYKEGAKVLKRYFDPLHPELK